MKIKDFMQYIKTNLNKEIPLQEFNSKAPFDFSFVKLSYNYDYEVDEYKETIKITSSNIRNDLHRLRRIGDRNSKTVKKIEQSVKRITDYIFNELKDKNYPIITFGFNNITRFKISLNGKIIHNYSLTNIADLSINDLIQISEWIKDGLLEQFNKNLRRKIQL